MDLLLDGDPEFLVFELVNLLATYPDLISDIDGAVLRQDAEAICRAAHTMKGAVANFGAAAVVEQARTIEMIGKSGDLADAREATLVLWTLMDRFAPQLEAAAAGAEEAATWT